jgi:hypothetical protein
VRPRASVDCDGENSLHCPWRESDTGSPARSKSLYWLSYSGPNGHEVLCILLQRRREGNVDGTKFVLADQKFKRSHYIKRQTWAAWFVICTEKQETTFGSHGKSWHLRRGIVTETDVFHSNVLPLPYNRQTKLCTTLGALIRGQFLEIHRKCSRWDRCSRIWTANRYEVEVLYWTLRIIRSKLSLGLTKYQAHKDAWGNRGIALCTPDFGVTWRWVVSFAPRPLYHQGNSFRHPLHRRLGGS